MTTSVWPKAIKACAAPERARQFLERLRETDVPARLEKVLPEQARLLTALFSGSQVLSEQLAAHPEWLDSAIFAPDLLRHPRQLQGLGREVKQGLDPLMQKNHYAACWAPLRQFKQREMLRIAVRDLGRLGTVEQTMQEISNLADVCLDAVYQLCWRQFVARFGQPYHQDARELWQLTGFCIIGLGKLGGQELNYSSDVDVIFVYAEEGSVFKTPPGKSKAAPPGLSNHQFFVRLAEAIVAEVGRLSPEGQLFRIDLRLRPEGHTGPLARSLASYENFYAQWGQTWERMMLIKARRVAGDAELGSEFMEMVQPFRYPRFQGDGIVREVASMKQRIEAEVVKAGEIERNVKLGRGGIREIEFIVQTLQVLHAGRLPFLQGAQTLPTLEKLVDYNLISAADARVLTEAYRFLREVEHRLQMEANRQTHTIPTDRSVRERLARLMGARRLTVFENDLQTHTQNVRNVYQRMLQTNSAEPPAGLPSEFDGAEAEWKQLLAEHSFRDADKALRILHSLVHGPGYGHVSPRTAELAWQFLPRLLALCPRPSPPASPGDPAPAQAAETSTRETKIKILSDPDRVLARLDSFVTAYGARALMFETWTSTPSLFELLLLLFDRSEFLAEVAIRTPDLLDELAQSGQLRRSKTAAETLKDLEYGTGDPDQRQWIRRYHQAELMRIGLRDILGLVDAEQNLAELTALAEACVQYALQTVLKKHQRTTSPFAIIGLGKLGGAELTYGSDLDVIFVADVRLRDLSKIQRLAVELMDLLASQTELGTAYAIDARLRPDGAKGLLVNTLEAYEEYYRHRAMLWEIQTLTRTRPVAGDPRVSQRFSELAGKLTNFRSPNLPLAAYTPAWKSEIARMRQRIEKERTPPGQQALAFKTGAGGLMDAEFIAQILCLMNGWHEPNTLRALQRARTESALPVADTDALIQNFIKLQRLEVILRRWSSVGESELPNDPAPMYRVAVRCGFPDAPSFTRAVADWRQAIREVYRRFMADTCTELSPR